MAEPLGSPAIEEAESTESSGLFFKHIGALNTGCIEVQGGASLRIASANGTAFCRHGKGEPGCACSGPRLSAAIRAAPLSSWHHAPHTAQMSWF